VEKSLLDLIPLGGIYYKDHECKKKDHPPIENYRGSNPRSAGHDRKNDYCIDVITQTSAVKQALSSIEDNIMEDHLKTCVVNQIKKGKEKTAVGEIVKVYKLKRK